MEKYNLNVAGLSELTTDEVKSIDGGLIGWFLLGLGAGTLVAILIKGK